MSETKEESIEDSDVFLQNKKLKNPFVIIIGISKYEKYDEREGRSPGHSDLKSVETDIKELEKLFKETYNYENVTTILNKIEEIKSITEPSLRQLLIEKRSDITTSLTGVKPIDGMIIYYCGHGNEDGIITSDGSVFKYRDFQDLFDNAQILRLRGYPRLIYFDCCRGTIEIKTFKLKPRGGEVVQYTNKYKDWFFTYGAAYGARAYGDEYGLLTKAITKIYSKLPYMCKTNVLSASVSINRFVGKESSGIQSPVVENSLDYQVYLLPNNSDYDIIFGIDDSNNNNNNVLEKSNTKPLINTKVLEYFNNNTNKIVKTHLEVIKLLKESLRDDRSKLTERQNELKRQQKLLEKEMKLQEKREEKIKTLLSKISNELNKEETKDNIDNDEILKLFNNIGLINAKTTSGVLLSTSLINDGYNNLTNIKNVFVKLNNNNKYLINKLKWSPDDSNIFITKAKEHINFDDVKIDENNNNSNTIKNNLYKNSKFIKYLKNPYVIIMGISNYREHNETGRYDLPSSKNNVKIMENLFKNIYGYKHVVTILDKIGNKSIHEETFEEFLSDQRNTITNLFRKKNEESPDGLIFYYSGHSDKNNIMLSNYDRISYEEIKYVFNNKQLIQMAKKPHLFFFDACHGTRAPRVIKNKYYSTENNNNVNSNLTITSNNLLNPGSFKYISNENINNKENNKENTNRYMDSYVMFASTYGHKSLNDDNDNIGYMTKAMNNAFSNDCNYNNIELKIKQLVKEYSQSKQTVETFNSINYNVVFIPQNNKTNISRNINNMKFHVIKNPYIIITGVSELLKLKLDSVKVDIPKLNNLFLNECKFRNVISILDKINNESISRLNFLNFLKEQRQRIINLCKQNSGPDAIIFYFGGHGVDSEINLSDSTRVRYREIIDIFDNKSIQCMIDKPKLFYFDCSHGKFKGEMVALESDNSYNNNIKSNNNNIIPNNYNNNNNKKTLITNKNQDIKITFAAVKGTQAYADTNGHLTNGILNAFTQLKKQIKMVYLRDLEIYIQTLVSQYSGYQQTVEIQDTIDSHIFFNLS